MKKGTGTHWKIIVIIIELLLVIAGIAVILWMQIHRSADKNQKTEVEPETAIGVATEEAFSGSYDELQELTIDFIDVGFGDAALLQCGGESAMIDTGSLTVGKTDIVSFLERKNVEELKYLILSHSHEDHIGAAYNIFWKSDIKVDHAVYDFKDLEDSNASIVNNSVIQEEIPIIEPKEGTSFQLGDAEFTVLLGREEAAARELPEEETLKNQQKVTNTNNESIAILVTHGENTFLFTGDEEQEAEEILLKQNPELRDITVLKAPHHGGDTSCSEEMLNQLNPQEVVISSTAPQIHKLPKEKLLKRLEEHKIPVYKTYESGTITVISDGKTIETTTEK